MLECVGCVMMLWLLCSHGQCRWQMGWVHYVKSVGLICGQAHRKVHEGHLSSVDSPHWGQLGCIWLNSQVLHPFGGVLG